LEAPFDVDDKVAEKIVLSVLVRLVQHFRWQRLSAELYPGKRSAVQQRSSSKP